MRPYPRFGGESVSFAKTSLALHILYYLYLLLSPLRRLSGSSGLLCKLAHPVHLKMHRCVIPLSPPQKKKPVWGSFSVAERVYHSQQLLSPCTYFILYFCFFPHYGFYQAHQVCALSAQTCAPCAFKNAQVCDPTLSVKTKEARLGLLSFWRRECIIRNNFSRPAHTLLFIFASFPTMAFVRLIRFALCANLRTLCI